MSDEEPEIDMWPECGRGLQCWRCAAPPLLPLNAVERGAAVCPARRPFHVAAGQNQASQSGGLAKRVTHMWSGSNRGFRGTDTMLHALIQGCNQRWPERTHSCRESLVCSAGTPSGFSQSRENVPVTEGQTWGSLKHSWFEFPLSKKYSI